MLANLRRVISDAKTMSEDPCNGDPMRQIRVLTMDLDDTLWAISGVIERAERLLHDWLNHRYPRVTDRFGVRDLREMRNKVASENPHLNHDLTTCRLLSLEQVMTRCGYPTSAAKGALEVFARARNQVHLFDDVLPALGRFTTAFSVGAITNGNADIAQIGLGRFFSFVISAREAGAAKPDASPFIAAMRKLGASADQVLHVGDDPINDIAGAKAVGIKTAWVNRQGSKWVSGEPPDIEIPDLLTLADYLLGIEEKKGSGEKPTAI